jgi:hypothetical protein
MENAHLRLGRLKFIRQTKDHATNVSLHLNQLVAEKATDRYSSASLHLISVFGGDQEVGAIGAAAAEEQRFHVEMFGDEFVGTMGEKPISYKASIPVSGRKRPVRHLVLISKSFFETTLGSDASANRTVLYDDSPDFVLHRLAVRFGLPVLPEWADWFHGELRRRKLIDELTGLNCSPVAVKGDKTRMLRILSQGLRRRQIQFPAKALPVHTEAVDAA